MMNITRQKNRGFTLIEILIVAALIALLSGIAIFSINEFYNNNIRKAVIGEVNQIATAASFANDDLQFFPKLHLLSDPASVIFKDPATGLQNPNQVIPGIDYFGFIPGGQPPQLTKLQNGWRGPYMGMSMTRDRSSRGSRSGIVKMRLPDVYFDPSISNATREALSLVDWPADVWGNPYVFYQLRSSADVGGNLLPEFVDQLGENADYLNAIVSYGKNGYPGGNDMTPGDPTQGPSATNAAGTLFAGALYVRRDALGTGAHFTLKVATSDPAIVATIPPNLLLHNGTTYHFDVLNGLKFDETPYLPLPVNQSDCSQGLIGMLEDCNDDIVYEF